VTAKSIAPATAATIVGTIQLESLFELSTLIAAVVVDEFVVVAFVGLSVADGSVVLVLVLVLVLMLVLVVLVVVVVFVAVVVVVLLGVVVLVVVILVVEVVELLVVVEGQSLATLKSTVFRTNRSPLASFMSSSSGVLSKHRAMLRLLCPLPSVVHTLLLVHACELLSANVNCQMLELVGNTFGPHAHAAPLNC
jgi:hypothetical protein